MNLVNSNHDLAKNSEASSSNEVKIALKFLFQTSRIVLHHDIRKLIAINGKLLYLFMNFNDIVFRISLLKDLAPCIEFCFWTVRVEE